MPVGRWGWVLARAHFATASVATRVAIVALAILGALLYVATALWFDVAFWALGRFAAERVNGRARAAISVGFAIVIVAAIGLSSGRPAPAPTSSSGDLGAITGSVTQTTAQPSAPASPSIAPTQSLAPAIDTASPTAVDGDDEASDSASPPASVSPGPSGVAVGLPGSGSVDDRLPGEPDPLLTPGALNPAVTQASISSTICVSGWTATIRPSSSYTTGLKVQQIVTYGYADTSTSSYEEDHLISLELGGAPTDPRNLWPEPYTISLADGRSTGAHTKDGFETSLKNKVCSGAITLAQAQASIGIHWAHAYYGIPLGAGTPTAGPTAVPTAGPTTVPTTPPVASLSVGIAGLPASVNPGANATLVAVTAPGATCGASVRYASGTISTAAGLQTHPVAGSTGQVSWTWKVGTTTGAGTATATVTCSLGGDSASASKTFQVN